MKLAIITSKYPNSSQPYNHMFVHQRVKYMLQLGVDIQILVCSNFNKTYIYDGVVVQQLTNQKIVSVLGNFNVLYFHLLNIYPFQNKDGWLIYQKTIQKKIPFCMYVHGNEVQKYSARSYEYNYSIAESLKWIKKDFWVIPKIKNFVQTSQSIALGRFIFPSKWMHKEMQRNLKLKIINPVFIPNGIETDFYSYQDVSQYRYNLLSIRSFASKVYDIEKTIEVMEYLPKKYTLTLYGQGKYLGEYKKIIKKKNLSQRVQIIERFLQPKEMLEEYRNHGVFLSTTRQDSQGLTILEAMSCGLLGVATLNTAKPEFIIHEKTGILGKTARRLALLIEKYTIDEVLFAQLTKKASKKMLEMNYNNTIEFEIEILNEI